MLDTSSNTFDWIHNFREFAMTIILLSFLIFLLIATDLFISHPILAVFVIGFIVYATVDYFME